MLALGRVTGSLLVVGFFAMPAMAFRMEFVAIHAGERVEGAEVCFFPADRRNQILSYFSSGEVHCLPADSVIDMPPGDWHFFSRHRSELASDWPGLVSIGEDDPDGYRAVTVQLTRAGTLDIAALKSRLQSEEHVVFYFPALHDGQLPFLIPVAQDEETLVVPSERLAYPIIAANGIPVWIGTGLKINGESTTRVSERPLSPRTLIASIRVDRDSIRRRGGFEESPPPSIAVESPNARKEAFPIRTLAEPDLVIVPDLPSGSVLHLVVEGGGWKHERRPLKEAGRDVPVVALRDPIDLELLAEVTIEWTVDPELMAGVLPCRESPTSGSGVRITLMECPGIPATGPSIARECRVVAEHADSSPSGEVSLADVEPGAYWVRLDAGVTPWQERFTLLPGERARLVVQPAYASIAGRITVDGTPMHASVRFSSGFAVTHPVTGSYRALVVADPGRNPIRVTACDSDVTYSDHPERPLRGGDVYDIDLVGVAVEVRTVDGSTDKAVANADCEIRSERDRGRPNIITLLKTDAEGLSRMRISRTILRRIEAEDAVMCCTHPSFQQGCIDWPAEMIRSSLRERTVRLERKQARHGRVLVDAPVVGGRLLWVSSAGRVTEQVNVSDDGAFVYELPHGLDEYLIFVSRSHPLYVLLSPGGMASEDLTVILPFVAIRSARIEPARELTESMLVGLTVGGATVPSRALTFHQMMRGNGVELDPVAGMVVRDIAETGAIAFLLGYPVSRIPAGAEQEDVFLAPHHRAHFPSAPLRADGRVRFE